MSVALVEVSNSSNFLVNGPTKRKFSVFEGHKKVIPIKFFPLEAGSTMLPQIVVTDVTENARKARKFMTPIVVTFE